MRYPRISGAPSHCAKDGSLLLRSSDISAAKFDPMLGRTLGDRFTIVAKLGAGSMGAVYRARQANINRDVALKILRSDKAMDEASKARFLREARANSVLVSPHTVTVFDFGQSESGELYLVMELLEGESLGQRLARQKRLSGAEDDVVHLFDVASSLGSKLGPVLFQLPPFARKDAPKLRAFLGSIPAGRQAAFEFRHPSWCDEEIYSILRQRDAPLCLSDTDESGDPDALVIPTASWGYMRLRRTQYSDQDLSAWAGRVAKQQWSEAYVFFKHEDEAKGPAFAAKFRELIPS